MRSIRNTLLLLTLCWHLDAFSQLHKEANNWYFSLHAGVEFTTGSPSALPWSPLFGQEGSATISDATGALLFYTTGDTVWDRSHNIMSNGTGLGGWYGATQSAVIIPRPGTVGIYYVFTNGYSCDTTAGLRYSLVDMSLNGGLGAVTTKGVQLLAKGSEKLTAVRHANCQDYWVLTHKCSSQDFVAYIVSDTGVSSPVVSTVGALEPWSSQGYLRLSPQGDVIASALYDQDSLEIGAFDNSTGVVSNVFGFEVPYQYHAYGVEFSRSGRFLYLSANLLTIPVYQYDLWAGTPAQIEASVKVVGSTYHQTTAMQMGPDGKIYIAARSNPHLDVINYPDSAGVACNFVCAQVPLTTGTQCVLGLPNFITSYFDDPFEYESNCYSEPTHFYVTDSCAIDSVHWNFGDTSSGSNTAAGFSVYHQFTASDTFTVSMFYFKDGAVDTATRDVIVFAQPPTVNLGADTTICNGDSVILNAYFPDATYLWSSGSKQDSLVAKAPGIYWVQVMNPCDTITDSIVISHFAINADFTAPIACVGKSMTFTDQSTAAGGITAWQWNFAGQGTSTQQHPSFTWLSGGIKQVTLIVTSGLGCYDTIVKPVLVNPSPQLSVAGDTAFCGTAIRQISATGTGTFLWSPGATLSDSTIKNPIATPTSTTIYTVTLTALSGCTNTDSVTITVSALPIVDAGVDVAICAGQQAQLAATGALTYVWEPGTINGQTINVSPTSTTTYAVTGVDVSGCMNTDSVTITVSALPVVDAGADQSICDGQQAQLAATGALTYTWEPGTINGQTINVSPTSTTTYTVTGVDVSGCENTDSVTVTVNPLLVVDAGNDTAICRNFSLTLEMTPPMSAYLWSTGDTTQSITVAPSSTTTYTVTGTDANGCVDDDTITITVNPLPVVFAQQTPTGPICLGQSVQLNATGGSQYYWDVNALGLSCYFCPDPIASPTTTTTFSVTVEDANGCTKDTSMTVTVLPLPVVDAGVDTAICEGQQAQLAATGALNYTWEPGTLNGQTINVSPTATTTYTVTGTDVNGCEGTDDVTVIVNALPVVDAGSDTAICRDFSLTLEMTPPLISYLWSTGDTTQAISVQPSVTTTYSVTGTDVNGCQASDSVMVTVNALPVVDVGVDQTICEHASTVLSVTPTLSSYLWSPGDTTQAISVQPTVTTTYWVIGTDANGCEGTDSVTITVIPAPVVVAQQVPAGAICEGETVTLIASGADTYDWTPGGPGASIVVTPSATQGYLVTGTDANGCSDTATIIVTVNPLPIVDAGVDQDICDGQQAQLAATGAMNYVWSTGDVTPAISVQPSATTTYSVIGTDVNGCDNVDDVTVIVHALPVVDAGADQSICIDASLTLSMTPPMSSYLWSTGETTQSIIVAPTITTTYFVTGTDIWGCEDDDDVTVSVFALPTVNAFPSEICKGEQALLTAGGALIYSWQPGGMSGDSVLVMPNFTTTFTVTGFDANGCESSSTVVVTVRNDCPQPTPVVEIPTAFSPNGDGLNDVFRIEHAENFSLTSLRIFNRWGQVVFETTDISEGWDGSYQGREQGIGGYVFLVVGSDASGEPMTLNGNVTVVR